MSNGSKEVRRARVRPGKVLRFAGYAGGVALALAVAMPARAQTAEWTPLRSDQVFTEFTQAWIPVPNGSSGTPRQGWLATVDGFFTREAHLAWSFTNAEENRGFQFLGRFNYPLSRRFWVGLEVPFYEDFGPDNGFGDISITTLAMLHETRDTSISAGIGWPIPTGAGDGDFTITPQVDYFTDVGNAIALRGRVSDLADFGGSDDAVRLALVIGKTVTPHEETPSGDFATHLAPNWTLPADGGTTSFTITPGVRTHLFGNLFLLAGVEFEHPNREDSFNERYILQFVQGL